jgi:hypothetical protein
VARRYHPVGGIDRRGHRWRVRVYLGCRRQLTIGLYRNEHDARTARDAAVRVLSTITAACPPAGGPAGGQQT